MSSSAPVASLPDDIQRALQQAVGDANNAASAHLARNNTRKNKRPRGDEDTADIGGGGGDGASGVVKKKKKSKKHHAGDVDGSSPSEQTASGSGSPGESIVPNELATTEGAGGADDLIVPAKKKKKGKGKERAQDVPLPVSGVQPAAPPMDSADFLSAVVAAASATSGQQTTYDQSVPQYLYQPGEFDPYAFAGPQSSQSVHQPPQPPPQHVQPPLPHPHPPAFPGSFPVDPTAILPELNFASSEDLLRSLQDFDISKVVTVLKTLGEAAAAANVQLNGPPMFGPGPQLPLPAPPVQQQPVRSEAILGRPPKQKKGKSASAAVAPPAPLQPDNPEHAHMLANVWMNATKLAELVKTEGELLR